MTDSIDDLSLEWTNVPYMPTSWHLWGSQQMAVVIPEGHFLLERVRHVIRNGRLTQEYEGRWIGIKRGTIPKLPPSRTKEVDNRADLILGSFYDDLIRIGRFARDGSEDKAAVIRIQQRCFPATAAAIIRLPVVEQLAMMIDVQSALQGPLAQDVQRLGLTYWARALDEILPEYQEVVDSIRRAEFSFPDLAQARTQDRVLIAKLTIDALHHAAHHPEDAALVASMLNAYSRAAERYRSTRKTRSSSINPDTGEFTDEPDEP